MKDKDLHKILDYIKHEKTLDRGFRLIVANYKERLYWLIRRILISHDDTNDALQDTFVKIWQNIQNYRGDAELYTWLYRIAVNEALGFLKKKKRQHLGLSNYGEVLSQQLESDVYFEGNEFQKTLQKAILTLPEQQRLVFNMKYFEEIKYKDMAVILDKSEGALKANYHHAVKKIEEFVKTN
ncbi:MAG: RNA polymerase subunit sigma-70 [Bacteroidetes bacterium 4572_77]|nr:MAG: RNA polymerase subunit sigma-70 [Bacteroidetes bacterium 4572_77]